MSKTTTTAHTVKHTPAAYLVRNAAKQVVARFGFDSDDFHGSRRVAYRAALAHAAELDAQAEQAAVSATIAAGGELAYTLCHDCRRASVLAGEDLEWDCLNELAPVCAHCGGTEVLAGVRSHRADEPHAVVSPANCPYPVAVYLTSEPAERPCTWCGGDGCKSTMQPAFCTTCLDAMLKGNEDARRDLYRPALNALGEPIPASEEEALARQLVNELRDYDTLNLPSTDGRYTAKSAQVRALGFEIGPDGQGGLCLWRRDNTGPLNPDDPNAPPAVAVPSPDDEPPPLPAMARCIWRYGGTAAMLRGYLAEHGLNVAA